jgi:hypothetical protein
VAAVCRSDKRLELQLEAQAASAIEDEAPPRRPAVQTTALYGFAHQKRVRASLPAHLPVSGSSSRRRIPALLRRQAEQAARGHYGVVPRQWNAIRPSKKFTCRSCEKITQRGEENELNGCQGDGVSFPTAGAYWAGRCNGLPKITPVSS